MEEASKSSSAFSYDIVDEEVISRLEKEQKARTTTFGFSFDDNYFDNDEYLNLNTFQQRKFNTTIKLSKDDTSSFSKRVYGGSETRSYFGGSISYKREILEFTIDELYTSVLKYLNANPNQDQLIKLYWMVKLTD
jgi:hypothetical protein